MNQRPALPYPKQALRDREYLRASSRATKTKLYERLQQEYHDLQYTLELLEARLDAVSTWRTESKAAPTPVTTSAMPAILSTIHASIGQLRWMNNLDNNYNELGDSAGNTSGVAWCNGILLTNELFLSAGHCFDKSGGWQRPNHYGAVPPPNRIASLFNVCFAEAGHDTHQVCFKVDELVHHRPWGLDCAIVRLSQCNSIDEKPRLPTPLIHYLAAQVAPGDNHVNLMDKDVYLLDHRHPQSTADSTPKAWHKVNITRHQNTAITFASSANENTPSGTPLVTHDGHIVGIKLSSTQALDIGSMHQLPELNMPELNTSGTQS